MAAVKVRILVWLPPAHLLTPDAFEAHLAAHFYLARLVQRCNEEAKTLHNSGDDLGVVFLDARLAAQANLAVPFAKTLVPSHHQKFIVIRGGATHVAFCGGVDLAYTRRDVAYSGDWQSGSAIPQQDIGIKTDVTPATTWEPEVTVPTEQFGTDLPQMADNSLNPPAIYGNTLQNWHDQHLRLEGPVVATLEHVFQERWADPAETTTVLGDSEFVPFDSIVSSSADAFESVFRRRTHLASLSSRARYYVGHGVQKRDVTSVAVAGRSIEPENYRIIDGSLSFRDDTGRFQWPEYQQQLVIAYETKRPRALPDVTTPPAPASITPAKVAIWQTIPFRGKARGAWDGHRWARQGDVDVDTSDFVGDLTDGAGRDVPSTPYRLGEFSTMAGIANACQQAREFIWIFDQYFWSVPYARLLAKQLGEHPTLHVVIVLPPWSDMTSTWLRDGQHALRSNALRILNTPVVRDRVAVYFPWVGTGPGSKGMYCHAKTQLFDDQLLVCGSCNLNERSFGVDTEICCAVESPEIVRAHYKNLWDHFINPVPVGNQVPFSSDWASGWGARLFVNLFDATTDGGTHFLQYDDGARESPPTTILPNGLVRSVPLATLAMLAGEEISEPHGLPDGVYGNDRNLAEIVEAMERVGPSTRQAGW